VCTHELVGRGARSRSLAGRLRGLSVGCGSCGVGPTRERPPRPRRGSIRHGPGSRRAALDQVGRSADELNGQWTLSTRASSFVIATTVYPMLSIDQDLYGLRIDVQAVLTCGIPSISWDTRKVRGDTGPACLVTAVVLYLGPALLVRRTEGSGMGPQSSRGGLEMAITEGDDGQTGASAVTKRRANRVREGVLEPRGGPLAAYLLGGEAKAVETEPSPKRPTSSNPVVSCGGTTPIRSTPRSSVCIVGRQEA